MSKTANRTSSKQVPASEVAQLLRSIAFYYQVRTALIERAIKQLERIADHLEDISLVNEHQSYRLDQLERYMPRSRPPQPHVPAR